MRLNFLMPVWRVCLNRMQSSWMMRFFFLLLCICNADQSCSLRSIADPNQGCVASAHGSALAALGADDESVSDATLQLLQLQVDGTLAEDRSSSSRDGLKGLPDDLGQVASIFNRVGELEKKHPTYANALPADILAVFGVFSMAPEGDLRMLIRSGWMNQSGVCPLLSQQSKDCVVYAGFIVGTGRGKPVDDNHNDILVLDMEENMNEGKSYQYFFEASRKFTWATHIVKLDTDTYPLLHILLPKIANVSRFADDGCGVYLGQARRKTRLDQLVQGNAHVPPSCGYSLNGDYLKYEQDGVMVWNATIGEYQNERCFAYMSGALYVLSRGLAEGATESGGAWDRNRNGHEDIVTGLQLRKYGSERNVCISTWDPVIPKPDYKNPRTHRDTYYMTAKGWLHAGGYGAFEKIGWAEIEKDLENMESLDDGAHDPVP